jgi:hypothetical protein
MREMPQRARRPQVGGGQAPASGSGHWEAAGGQACSAPLLLLCGFG